MAERSDMPLADASGATPNDVPTGMPQGGDEIESDPLGSPETDPDGEGETQRGEKAQPGIPSEGEPPASG